jgi:PAS domain S-box-containing protein
MVYIKSGNPVDQDREVKIKEPFSFAKGVKPKRGQESLDYAALAYIPNPIMVCNPDLSMAYINPVLETMTGFSQKELLGKKPPYPFWNDSDNLKFETEVQQNRRGENCFTEHLVHCKNGEQVSIRTKMCLVKENNTLKHILVHWTDITGRKNAVEALRESEAFNFSLLNNAPNPVIVTNPDTSIKYVNPAFEKLTGFTAAELIGVKPAYPYWSMKSSPGESSNFEKVIWSKTAYRVERTFRKKNGELFQVEVAGVPVLDAEGHLKYFISNWVDVTERYRILKDLHESENFNNSILANAPNPILVINADQTIQYINPAFEKLTGYERAELIGRGLPFPWWTEEIIQKYEKAGRPEALPQLVNAERCCRKKDGTLFWVLANINPITENGKIKYLLGNWIDITERKKMEEKLRLAADEWRTTFDAITEMIFIQDREGKIIRMNRAFAAAFHKLPQELIGLSGGELIPAIQGTLLDYRYQKSQDLPVPLTAGFFEPSLGMDIEASGSPITAGNGEYLGSVNVLRDVTEHKKFAEKLMLTDRLATIGELAAGVAHELNNPLTSIIGFSQLVLEEEVPPVITDDLKIINSESQRAAKIVKNLLTFGRKHQPVKQLNQINDCIDEVLSLRAYEHKCRNIKVINHLDRDLPRIMFDYFQMQQVFINLIINAEFFMSEAHRGGNLTVTTETAGKMIRASVADDGPGIPPENLKHLFNPFFTTKEVGKGTGLGLAICHGIISEHGGNIYARSEPGKGAAFVVELPV